MTNLQFVTEVLGVGDEAAVLVSLVEPQAAPHLRGLLVPVHGFAQALVQEHVVAAAVCAQHHALGVRLDWDTQPHLVTTLTLTQLCPLSPAPATPGILQAIRTDSHAMAVKPCNAVMLLECFYMLCTQQKAWRNFQIQMLIPERAV